MKKKITEKEVRAGVRAVLKQQGFLVIPYVPGLYGMKGCADLLCCGTVDGVPGRFVAIELKRPGGKVSPEQTKFLEKVRGLGGVAFVAESTQDVISNLHLPALF
jgi:hypothetical protein